MVYWFLKCTFNILFTRGRFFKPHMLPISCSLFYIHIAETSLSFTPGHHNQPCAAGTVRRLRCTSVVAAEGEDDLDMSSCITVPLHYQQSVELLHNRISRHLFTSPSTGGDKWNQYTGSREIPPLHCYPQVYIIADLYRAELIMKHSSDLLTWKIGNYGLQSAVLVECRYCKSLTIFWNCYGKQRGSTIPHINQCSS